MPEKRKTRLLIDMDGVLVDFETSLFQAYRLENPEKRFILPSNRIGMYMDQQYLKEFGETEYQILRDLLDRPGFYGVFESYICNEIIFSSVFTACFEDCISEIEIGTLRW